MMLGIVCVTNNYITSLKYQLFYLNKVVFLEFRRIVQCGVVTIRARYFLVNYFVLTAFYFSFLAQS